MRSTLQRFGLSCLVLITPLALASPAQFPSAVALSMHYDASALAVAGAPAGSVDVLRIASAGRSQLLAELATAQTNHRAALAAVGAERRQMAAAGSGADSQSRLATLEANLANATASLEQAETDVAAVLRNALALQVTSNDLAIFDRFRANAERDVPMAWRVLDLNDVQWEALAAALSEEAASSEPVFTAEQRSLLALARANSDVALAEARLTTLRPGLEAAFSAAIQADFDNDGFVGLKDLQILLMHFGQQGAVGDVDRDGRVNLDDLQRLLFAFGSN